MIKYYVSNSAENTGQHEVHQEDCPFLYLIVRKTYISEHASCQSAMVEAKKRYANVDGCATCSTSCYTR